MDHTTQLQEDILLSFHSISAKQGHFGTSTEYIAAEHRVVYRKWGAKRRLFGLLPPRQIPKTAETLDIPPEITGEAELREYVRRNRPGWMRGRDQRG